MGVVPLTRWNSPLSTGLGAARAESGDMHGHIDLLGLSGEGLPNCL